MNHSEKVVISSGAGSDVERAVARRIGNEGPAVACGDLEYVADAAAFLTSADASTITGPTLDGDGRRGI